MADSDLPASSDSQDSPDASTAPKPAVPPVGHSAGDAFGALVELMRILRAPGGCPWDREQTLDTLKPFVLEEAHEVIDAIERRDFDDLQGEIGDLIFEGVFLAQLCADEQRFTVTEALRDVHAKLVRRHPHVFGDASGERPEGVDTPNAVKGQWEQVKADERAAKGQPRRGMFDGIPKTLPALLAAYEIGNRAAATGFDWPAATEVLDKIEEEAGELRETLEQKDRARQEEELGDLLFAVTNLARKLGIEPEAALRAANRKFISRFDAMQARLESRGRALGQATLDEMEHAWQAVKRGER
jgi:nucleoside triphosphate diphosphatase